MKKHVVIVAVASAVAGLFAVGSSWSQQIAEDSMANVPHNGELPANDYRLPLNPSSFDPGDADQPGARIQTIRSNIEQIMQQLRQSERDSEKAELVDKLEIVVAQEFDEDLKMREAVLAQLEARLNKLRSQLERRRKAKAEITRLHTQVLASEAEGLGFSSGNSLVPGQLLFPSSATDEPMQNR